MNIALCYSGQVRHFTECYPTQVKHLIEANPDHTFYKFGHFWSDATLDGERFLDKHPERDNWSVKKDCEILTKNFNSVIFESPIDFDSDLEPDSRFPHPIQNTLSMFFGIQTSNAIKVLFSSTRQIQFDCVIRLRTDLFFRKDICLSNEYYDFTNCYLNDQYIHTSYAVNDLFAFGNSDIMDKYSSVYSNIPALVEADCAVNPECLLGSNLNAHKVNVKKTPLQNHVFDLYRDTKK
jgi:hypothetical protein